MHHGKPASFCFKNVHNSKFQKFFRPRHQPIPSQKAVATRNKVLRTLRYIKKDKENTTRNIVLRSLKVY